MTVKQSRQYVNVVLKESSIVPKEIYHDIYTILYANEFYVTSFSSVFPCQHFFTI